MPDRTVHLMFLVDRLKDEDFQRLVDYIKRAGQLAGVGVYAHSHIVGHQEERWNFFTMTKTIGYKIECHTNVFIDVWRDDHNLEIIDRFCKEFLEELSRDEWHNVMMWYEKRHR